jgi:hypothetical protein
MKGRLKRKECGCDAVAPLPFETATRRQSAACRCQPARVSFQFLEIKGGPMNVPGKSRNYDVYRNSSVEYKGKGAPGTACQNSRYEVFESVFDHLLVVAEVTQTFIKDTLLEIAAPDRARAARARDRGRRLARDRSFSRRLGNRRRASWTRLGTRCTSRRLCRGIGCTRAGSCL